MIEFSIWKGGIFMKRKILKISILLLILLSLTGCFIIPNLIAYVNFEAFAVGSTYTVGTSISEFGTTMVFQDYWWYPATPYSGGYGEIKNLGEAGHIGKDMWLNNINLNFGFVYPRSEISLNFGYYGGSINLYVNDAPPYPPIIVGDPMNLSGSYGSFNVNVVNLGSNKYKLVITGTINSFAIGGQEFVIDHVVAKK
jgi:hypothetical protein